MHCLCVRSLRVSVRVSMCSLLCIAIVLQFSLTHGYLPYGSSDVLVRSPPVCPPNIALFCLLRALFVTVLHYFYLFVPLLPALRYGVAAALPGRLHLGHGAATSLRRRGGQRSIWAVAR